MTTPTTARVFDDAVVEAIAVVEASRKTHVEWLAYYDNVDLGGCAECVARSAHHAKTAGDRDHQIECIAGYDKVLAVLRGRRAAAEAAEAERRDWADWIEQHDGNVGATPITIEDIVTALRYERPPFGLAATTS